MLTSNINLQIKPIGIYSMTDVEQEEQYALIENILKTQHSKPNQEKWDTIWGDHRKTGDYKPKWLTLNSKTVYRWNGEFVKSNNIGLERSYAELLRIQLFYKYLTPMDTVIEFGAGTGHNMLSLKTIFPDKCVWGSDFSKEAVEMHKEKGLDSFLCDMTKVVSTQIPQRRFPNERVAAFTFGAMEQLGEDYKNFACMCKDYRFDLIVQVEPLRELYTDSRFDKLALEYHNKRGYLGDYVSYVKNLPCGYNRIKELTRTGFGNMFNEGYMVLVWTP